MGGCSDSGGGEPFRRLLYHSHHQASQPANYNQHCQQISQPATHPAIASRSQPTTQDALTRRHQRQTCDGNPRITDHGDLTDVKAMVDMLRRGSIFSTRRPSSLLPVPPSSSFSMHLFLRLVLVLWFLSLCTSLHS